VFFSLCCSQSLRLCSTFGHAALTGVPNDRILANLRLLAAEVPDRVTVRLPLVPGATADRENVDAVATLVAGVGLRSAVVEPYHSLGVPKYADFGRPGPCDPGPPSDEDVARAIEAFRSRGIACETA
jgi:pyruvate-formate lyase-activating enzyme